MLKEYVENPTRCYKCDNLLSPSGSYCYICKLYYIDPEKLKSQTDALKKDE